MELNPEQQAAVETIEGPVLVFAGAGSGKTRVITHRMRNMILNHGISAQSILALSFTNKSAREMKTRLMNMVPRNRLNGIFLGTFHSLGVRILEKEITRLGYRRTFSIFTPAENGQIIGDILKAHKLSADAFDPKFLIWSFSQAKNKSFRQKEQIHWLEENYEPKIADLFTDYLKHLKSYNAVDFDDLINLPSYILETYEEVRQKYRQRIRFILVDEFQDTNPSQYQFLKFLLNPEHNNIMVVGDDDQSIYGWRGADVQLILNFERDFPGAKAIRLEQNYRSTGTILEAANRVIRRNSRRAEKSLKSNSDTGSKIHYILAGDEAEEAIFVVEKIEEFLRSGIRGNDIAILMRTNFQSRAFEEELRRRSIAYRLIGGYNFYDRKEVKDILSYLRVIANPNDEVSLMRVINYPRRGIGEKTIARINQYCLEREVHFWEALQRIMREPGLLPEIPSKTVAQLYKFTEIIENFRKEFFNKTTRTQRKLGETLRKLVQQVDYEGESVREGDREEVTKAKMYNINELISSLYYFENNWEEPKPPSLQDYLTRVSLQFEDNEEKEEKRGRVQMMTVHLSKGLEFPHVFIVGMENHIFPNQRAVDERPEGIEEERRLFYVALTRGMSQVCLSGCLTRRKFGEWINSEPSRFIEEIGEDLVEEAFAI